MKSVFLYLFLVGIPVMAIAGILHYGGGLEAPPSIGGTWQLALSVSAGAGPACIDVPVGTALEISQSGVYLLLTLKDPLNAQLSGRLDHARVEAVGGLAAAGSCAGHPLALRADLQTESGEPRLVGSLAAAECGACAPVPFRAAPAKK